MQALQAIQDETPAPVKALNCKDRGNKLFKRGPEFYEDAITSYTVRAPRSPCPPSSLTPPRPPGRHGVR